MVNYEIIDDKVIVENKYEFDLDYFSDLLDHVTVFGGDIEITTYQQYLLMCEQNPDFAEDYPDFEYGDFLQIRGPVLH